jgi:prepilin-type N-terminal cleavage/methylation domain-containing protein
MSRARRRRQAGVTLVELLIAVTLVSLLSVGILYAMRVGLVTLEHTNDKLLANRRVLGAQRILDQQVANMMSIKVQCNGPRDEEGGGTFQFFHGDSYQMRFVSRYGIQDASRGAPRVLEFAVIRAANHRGVRLVVNELPYTGPASTEPLCMGSNPDPATGMPIGRYPPVQTGPGSFVLADRLAQCRLAYQVVDPRGGNRIWVERFQGFFPPQAIRVEMAPLLPDSSRLQMTTTVVPVRLFRSARVVYKDIDEDDPLYQ